MLHLRMALLLNCSTCAIEALMQSFYPQLARGSRHTNIRKLMRYCMQHPE